MSLYCTYFGFKYEPFTAEISVKNLIKLPSMVSVKERFDYVMTGGVFIVTGEVGSGKSTSLRGSQAQFHPSQHLFLNITATGGSLIEFYRQLCWDLDIVVKTGSRAGILKMFKATVREIRNRKDTCYSGHHGLAWAQGELARNIRMEFKCCTSTMSFPG